MADCRVLRERIRKRCHAQSVAADGPVWAGARVVAVRMVLRADAVRQLLRRCELVGLDAVLGQSLLGK